MSKNPKSYFKKLFLFCLLVALVITLTSCIFDTSPKNKTYKVTKGNGYLLDIEFEVDPERILAVSRFKDSGKDKYDKNAKEIISYDYKITTDYNNDKDINISVEGTKTVKYNEPYYDTLGITKRDRSTYVYVIEIVIKAKMKGDNKLVGKETKARQQMLMPKGAKRLYTGWYSTGAHDFPPSLLNWTDIKSMEDFEAEAI